jgi:hypothetical protein
MMDFEKTRTFALPVQAPGEWRLFLEFCEQYFRDRGISRPIVVELGLQSNLQKQFYEEILGARHIGIDCSTKYSTPDILGDVREVSTRDELVQMLGDKPVNLLFMDAETSLPGVLREWELFEPLVRHLIAVHNIFSTDAHPTGEREFWRILTATHHREYRFVTFSEWLPNDHPCAKYQMGIGVVVKEP